MYDLYAEMFWAGHTSPDLQAWVRGYFRRRYGFRLDGSSACDPMADKAWQLLLRSVYSAPRGEIPGEQGATASDMAARPTLQGGRVPDTVDRPFYNVTDVEVAWGSLLQCAGAVGGGNEGFGYDVVAVGRQVLSDRFNKLRRDFEQEAEQASQAQLHASQTQASVPFTSTHYEFMHTSLLVYAHHY